MTVQTSSFPQAEGPAVWRGTAQESRDWVVHLDEQDCAELIRSAEPLRGRGLDSIHGADFPISERLGAKLSGVGETLEKGTGFVMLRGLPAANLPEDLIQLIYWGLGARLGVGVSQSAAGDRLGHVFDRGQKDDGRYYTRGGALQFHMDPVDVVGLLCLKPAKSGGASRIVSTGQLHNIIRAERPDLLEVLRRGFHNSRRGHGEAATTARIPVFAEGRYGVETWFLPVTIRQAEEEGHPLTPLENEAIDFVEQVANRPGVFLDMDFQVGDIQFLSNRTILHSRTDYVDFPEPERKRRLLRLWLMMPQWPARPESQNFHGRTDLAGGGVRPAHG